MFFSAAQKEAGEAAIAFFRLRLPTQARRAGAFFPTTRFSSAVV
jgi:hypothetical protein